MNEEEKNIELIEEKKKEVDSDLTKFLNKVYGANVREHTYTTPNNTKALVGMYVVGWETKDPFWEGLATRFMEHKLSEEGKNRVGIERVFTGIFSPAMTYKHQEIEQGDGEGNATQPMKKTKKGILRRFL